MQPDMIASAVHALQLLLEPARLLILFVGVVIGLAIGVLPGLNGIVGMAMLIPFTYNLDEYTAFALLLGMAAVITSSDFITAVLFGVPGHVGAAATVIDGHAMARKGEAGRAFGAGFAASLAGGIVGAIVLAVSIPILRPVMLSIGSPELLAFTLFGNFAAAFFGAGLEQARPAQVDALADAQGETYIGLAPQARQQPGKRDIAATGRRIFRNAVERRKHADLKVKTVTPIMHIKQDASDLLGGQVLVEHFGARLRRRQRRARF
jgi:hypothetical protein